jgi:hypothetical protein
MNNLIEEKKAQSEKQMDEYQPNRANHFWREILWVTWQRKQGFTFPPGSLGNLPWCIARKRSVTTAPGKGAAIPWLEKGISKGRPTAWEKPQGTPKQPTADLEFAKQGEIPISFRKVRVIPWAECKCNIVQKRGNLVWISDWLERQLIKAFLGLVLHHRSTSTELRKTLWVAWHICWGKICLWDSFPLRVRSPAVPHVVPDLVPTVMVGEASLLAK